ncbi:MAG: adenylyl-sulfate kinase [Lachnospiraceae bacterium]|nr:adenylyl-sulfate kinase [Lachnospiraceae bacterium]
MKKGILYWITGLSGSGKTTIGNRLYYELRQEKENVVLLDGDVLKNIVGRDLGYTEIDRRKRAVQYARICKVLTDQGIIVICCTIAMYDEVREWNRKNNKSYVEIFLDVPMDVLIKRDQKGIYSQYENGKIKNVAGIDIQVEFPKSSDLILKNDGSRSIRECVAEILKIPVEISEDYKRDTDYWNEYYRKTDIGEPSLFAQEIGDMLIPAKNILELGCGNGRDSIYFLKLGLNVTAIDSSDGVITQLKKKYEENNIYFICDDFVSSSAIFSGQYDYVYSRFTLHAINEEQEIEVLHNVYKVLKKNGLFFIEVRSINDELYGKGEKVGENSYIFNGHFRRFIKMKDLVNKMKTIGFEIVSALEKRGFAPYQGSNPPIIRIIAKR